LQKLFIRIAQILVNVFSIDSFLKIQFLLSGSIGKYKKILYEQFKYLNVELCSPFEKILIKVDDAYIQRDIKIHNQIQDKVVDITTIWKIIGSRKLNNNLFIIQSQPGMGKTTLIQHITIELCRKRAKVHDIQCGNFIPIPLQIKNFKDKVIENKSISLVEVIIDSFSYMNLSNTFFERLLKNNSLIMFDGLDELLDYEEKLISDWIKFQLKFNKGINFIVTLNIYNSFNNDLFKDSLCLEIAPLKLETEVSIFVLNWCKIYRKVIKNKNIQSDKLICFFMDNPHLAVVYSTPFNLFLLIQLFFMIGKLPDNQIDLYEKFIEISLKNSDYIKHNSIYNFLQVLAFRMSIDRLEEVSYSRLCQIFNNINFKKKTNIQVNGVFSKDKYTGTHIFIHKIIQDYLTSVYICANSPEQKILKDKVSDRWWHNIINFYSAQYKDASPIIETFVIKAQGNPQLLKLAYECRNNALFVNKKVYKKTNEIFLKGFQKRDYIYRSIATQVLMDLRVHEEHNYNPVQGTAEKVQIDNFYISCAEYDLFINEYKDNSPHKHCLGREELDTEYYLKPKINMSFKHANNFVQWFNFRLRKRMDTRFKYELPSFNIAINNPAKSDKIINEKFRFLSDNRISIWCSENKITPLQDETLHKIITIFDTNYMNLFLYNFKCDLEKIRFRGFIHSSYKKHIYGLIKDLSSGLYHSVTFAFERGFSLALTHDVPQDGYRTIDKLRSISLNCNSIKTALKIFISLISDISNNDIKPKLKNPHFSICNSIILSLSYQNKNKKNDLNYFLMAYSLIMIIQLSSETFLTGIAKNKSKRTSTNIIDYFGIIDLFAECFWLLAIIKEEISGKIFIREGIRMIRSSC